MYDCLLSILLRILRITLELTAIDFSDAIKNEQKHRGNGDSTPESEL